MADLREKMLGGEGPSEPEEWHELAVLLAGLVHFSNATGAELDAVGEALDAQSKQIELLVANQSPGLKKLMEAAGVD